MLLLYLELPDFESNQCIDWPTAAMKDSSRPSIAYNGEHHLEINQLGTSSHHLSHMPTKRSLIPL